MIMIKVQLKIVFLQRQVSKQIFMRVRLFFGTLLLFIFSVVPLFAQEIGEPCAGQDTDINGCPLDTWVFLIAIVAFVFTSRQLRNVQKKSGSRL